jgi:hypothetical protein
MHKQNDNTKMRPIPAVGLASALVQIIDYSINVLRKDHLIYRPSDAPTTPIENEAVLQDIIDNLYRLTDIIDQSELKKLYNEKNEQKKSAKLSEAAQQLLKYSEQVKELVEGLQDALIAVKTRGSPDDPQWPTARDALTNGVWKKKDVTGSKKKLRALRKEVDTSLLIALRQYLDQSAETGLPVFAQDNADVALRHWEKWQNDALDSIHASDWKPNKKKNVEEFSKIVDQLVAVENEAHFYEEIFKELYFEEVDERLHGVGPPMEGSMKWVFGDERMNDEGGLLDWLGNTRGENLFWVTGKPGCGKTTLTKYLFRNPQIFDYLEAWSGTSPGITSGFFFWNSGTELQNSSVGMLRSILYESLQDMIYGPLEEDQGVLKRLFSDRWNQFTSYGGGLQEFTFMELQKVFALMVSDASKKFFFMIDGLDEMDEHPNELVDGILNAVKKDNVKILVSSCASPELQTAFQNRPSLVLDEWTKKDSQAHILHAFGEQDVLIKLRSKADNVEEMNVINTLAEKADGVYLWAKLATIFLLQTTTEDDNFSAMRSRAGDLPPTLDLLLPSIVQSLDPEEIEQLWKIKTLLETHHNACPRLLSLSFALTADTKATIAADVRPLKSAETKRRVEDMRDLMLQKCKSLFTIFDTSSPEHPESRGRPESLKVTYTHRIIRSFLSAQTQPPGSTPFNPIAQWANAHLWTLKTLHASNDSDLGLWALLAACLESSCLMFAQNEKYPLAYVESASSSALIHYTKNPSTSDLPSFPSNLINSFLDLAVFLHIQPYIAIKAKNMDKKDIRHAIDFSREMRKRIGSTGEMKWLGVKGREELRKEYAEGRTDVDALLEYYGKTVRFGSAKTWVEVPEWE